MFCLRAINIKLYTFSKQAMQLNGTITHLSFVYVVSDCRRHISIGWFMYMARPALICFQLFYVYWGLFLDMFIYRRPLLIEATPPEVH